MFEITLLNAQIFYNDQLESLIRKEPIIIRELEMYHGRIQG
jgi:hypothetical protein